MKIIDLLNMISKGEEVPKKIKYKGEYWYLKQKYANRLPYYSNGYDKDNLFTGDEEEYFSESLNDEIEIIEDTPKISKLYINNKLQYDLAPKEDKKIEKLKEYGTWTKDETEKNATELLIIKQKINEIIDYINKGDK